MASHLAELGLQVLVDTAKLLVSELVANVVIHAHSEVEVVLCASDDAVIVEVHDGAGQQQPVRKHYSDTSTTGRGLMLVEALSRRWGVDNLGSGKVVWFELDRQVAS